MYAGSKFLSVTLFILRLAPGTARGDDVASLKSGFEKELLALSTGDLETVMGNQHEQILVMTPAMPNRIDGKVARRKDYAQLLSSMETSTVTPENPHYRVVGETGLLWGTYTIVVHPKGGEEATCRVRFSRTYIKPMVYGSCFSTMSLPFRTVCRVHDGNSRTYLSCPVLPTAGRVHRHADVDAG